MTRTYVHMDGMNLFHRSINMTGKSQSIDYQVGLAFHLMLNSLRKEFRKFKADHVVFSMDGHSWRKNVYKEYKLNRMLSYAQKTEKEKEDSQILSHAFDDLVKLLVEATNITVLHNEKAEADDMIATFIRTHPNDYHTVISTDSDYFQLLRYDNVVLYDPVKDITITRNGIIDDDGNRREFTLGGNAKIKVGVANPTFVPEEGWYNYALFLKIIRGDIGDYIFSAYPGVREKGTKKSVGIKEAYNDRDGKGYSWNTFMLTKWVDHNGVEHRVKDKYEFNRMLIDFDYAPDDIKKQCEDYINKELNRDTVPARVIGTSFLKFCGRWDLPKIANHAETFMDMLKNPYKEKEKDVTKEVL